MESIRSLPGRRVRRAATAALLLAIGGAVGTSSAQTYGPPAARPQSPSQPSSQSQAPSQPQAQSQPNAFRPEILAPLKAAEELIRAGKFGEALVKIREVDTVPNR